MSWKRLSLACTLAAAMAPHISFADPGTAFQYQGRLTDNGSPKTGTVGLRFTVWDDAAAGSQMGPTLTFPSVSALGGLFTQQLDFGDIFKGDALFLNIEVDGDGGSDNLTPLSPRRPLSPAPYAQHAGSLGISGSGPGLSVIDNGFASGGTTTTSAFHLSGVLGNLAQRGVIQDDATLKLGQALAVSASDRYAFVASPDGADSISIVDLVDPSNPVVVNNLTGTPFFFQFSGPFFNNIEYDAGFLYVVDMSGVKILNVSTAPAATLAGQFGAAYSAVTEVQVVGNYMYTKSGSNGLVVVDVTNKSAPTQVASVFLSGSIGFHVSNNRAYVFHNSKVTILDVSTPATPVQIGEILDSPVSNLSSLTALASQDGTSTVIVSSGTLMVALNAADPDDVIEIDALDLGVVADSLHMVGNRAYFASTSGDTIGVVDISDPHNLTLLQSMSDTTAGGTAIGLDGPRAIHCRGTKLHVASQVFGSYSVFDSLEPTMALTVDGIAAKSTGPYWSVFSDERLKQDIVPLDHSLDLITKLQPVQFRYAPAWQGVFGTAPDGRVHPGFVAQQYQQVFPDDVHTDPSSGYLQIDPSATLPHLVGAIKELEAEVEKLRGERKSQQAEFEAMAARLRALEQIQNDPESRR